MKRGIRSTGSVYRRGRLWWIKYYTPGGPVYESANTEKYAEAKGLLCKRVKAVSFPDEIEPAVPIVPESYYAANATGHVGAASELIASVALLQRGYYVFRNVSPNSPFDLVAYDGAGKLLRVEVKTRSAGTSLQLLGTDFDVLIVVGDTGVRIIPELPIISKVRLHGQLQNIEPTEQVQ